MRLKNTSVCGIMMASLLVVACGQRPTGSKASGQSAGHGAPSGSASAVPKAEAAPNDVRFTVDAAKSQVSFMMQAPQEKITGHLPTAFEGEIHVDPTNLKGTTGFFAVDLDSLTLRQSVADEEGGFGASTVNAIQNSHAKTWLEIGADAPEDVRRRNRRVEFSIRTIDEVSENDLTKLKGDTRSVQFKATGDFLLHGHRTTQTLDLKAEFAFAADALVSVHVTSQSPLKIKLADHDIRPRDGFGRLAKETLEVVSPKVASEVTISVDIMANVAQAFISSAGAAPAGAEKPAEKPAAADAPAEEGAEPSEDGEEADAPTAATATAIPAGVEPSPAPAAPAPAPAPAQ